MPNSIQASAWTFIAGFSEPPWPFIGLALAIVGGLMAVPPLLAMLYGQPDIRIRPDGEDRTKNRILKISIYNLPVTNWFLQRMRVRRVTVENFMAGYRIVEAGTDKVICDNPKALLNCALPASINPVQVSIINVNKREGRTMLHNGEAIQPGSYRAQIRVTETTVVHKNTFSFEIMTAEPFARWQTTERKEA